MARLAKAVALVCMAWAGQAVSADCDNAHSSAAQPSTIAVPEWQSASDTLTGSCASLVSLVARERAQTIATQAPAQTPTHAAAGYVPKTKDDNTPWRFDMNQNGRRMTADEFDAWMKAKGIRVATGKPAAEAAPTSVTTTSAAANCPASATVTC